MDDWRAAPPLQQASRSEAWSGERRAGGAPM